METTATIFKLQSFRKNLRATLEVFDGLLDLLGASAFPVLLLGFLLLGQLPSDLDAELESVRAGRAQQDLHHLVHLDLHGGSNPSVLQRVGVAQSGGLFHLELQDRDRTENKVRLG